MRRSAGRDGRRADRARRNDFLLALREAEKARNEDALIELLSEARVRGRTDDVGFAAHILAKAGADARLPVLLAMHDNARAEGDQDAARSALGALRRTRDDGAIPVLARTLREETAAALRTHAALGLAENGSADALASLRDALTSSDDRVVRAAAQALWSVTALGDDDQRLLLHHANWRFRWAMRRRRILRRLSGEPTTPDDARRMDERRRPVARAVHLAVSIGGSVAAVIGLPALGIPWPLVVLSVLPAALLGQVALTHLLAAVPGLPWRGRSTAVSDVVARARRSHAGG